MYSLRRQCLASRKGGELQQCRMTRFHSEVCTSRCHWGWCATHVSKLLSQLLEAVTEVHAWHALRVPSQVTRCDICVGCGVAALRAASSATGTLQALQSGCPGTLSLQRCATLAVVCNDTAPVHRAACCRRGHSGYICRAVQWEAGPDHRCWQHVCHLQYCCLVDNSTVYAMLHTVKEAWALHDAVCNAPCIAYAKEE